MGSLQKAFHSKLGLPTRENNGALFLVSEEDHEKPGHNKTFLQLRDDLKKETKKILLPDSDLADEEIVRCVKKNCLHVFKTDTAANRHYALAGKL